jgi:hypothetical protein
MISLGINWYQQRGERGYISGWELTTRREERRVEENDYYG